jgi:hypothetical protein
MKLETIGFFVLLGALIFGTTLPHPFFGSRGYALGGAFIFVAYMLATGILR